jgi:predicted AlkP superfamily pyrophosphatase or phosphodiesterase
VVQKNSAWIGTRSKPKNIFISKAVTLFQPFVFSTNMTFNKSIFLAIFSTCILISACSKEDIDYNCNEWTTVCADTAITIDQTKSNRKVLIIGIDGFRADAMQQSLSPFMYAFAQNEYTYFTDKNHVQELTFSGPNWGSLCTGVDFCKHMVTTNDFDGNRLDEFPHFFKYIEQANQQKNTVSIVNWTPINEDLASPFADYVPTESITDNDVFVIAKELLNQGNPLTPDLLFLQFDELDITGHDYGFNPDVPEYANYLTTLDGYVDSLVSIIEEKRLNGEEWLICIISDHGGDGKSHGGKYDNENVRHTIMYLNSPNETFKQWYTSSQTDLAPTVLDYLGVESAEFNCKTDGISVIED